MIIICPNCDKRYKIADEALGDGKKVRCANCEHRWFAAPPLDGMDVDSDIDDETDAASETQDQESEATEPTPAKNGDQEPAASSTPEASSKKPSPAESDDDPNEFLQRSAKIKTTRKTTSKAGLFGWLLVALITLGLAGLVLARNEIVSMFPSTASMYRMAGLTVTMDIGLEFREMISKRDDTGGTQAIVISAEIHNITTNDREVPPIRVALLDGDRAEIEYGLFDPPQPVMSPGAMMVFEARLIDPPEAAKSYAMTFETSPK